MEKLQPELRFPEFEGDWKLETLGSMSKDIGYGMNAAATTYDGLNKYIRITDIDETSRLFTPSPVTSPDAPVSENYRVKEGDILFARTGASVGKTYLYKPEDGQVYFAGFLIRFNIKGANPTFVFNQTFGDKYDKWVKVMSMRSGQPGINAEEYKSLTLYFPTLPEQTKIAEFLTAIDKRIELLTAKKEKLTLYKKGVMQKIFNQEIRFKDENSEEFPEWQEKALGEFLTQISREIEKPKESYISIGLRSHFKGTFQRADTDPEKNAMTKLYQVKPNDVVVNITFAWEGALAIAKDQDENGLVSHRFPTYIHDPRQLNLQFFQNRFAQKDFLFWMDMCSPGGAGRNRVLNKKSFLKIKIMLPIVEEQTKIANFLISMDKEIDLVDQQLTFNQTYKKGLLQKMFV